MKELNQHRSSWKGFRAHLTRLITSADELMTAYTGDAKESKVKTETSMESLIKELDHKERLIANLEAKIFPLINNKD